MIKFFKRIFRFGLVILLLGFVVEAKVVSKSNFISLNFSGRISMQHPGEGLKGNCKIKVLNLTREHLKRFQIQVYLLKGKSRVTTNPLILATMKVPGLKPKQSLSLGLPAGTRIPSNTSLGSYRLKAAAFPTSNQGYVIGKSTSSLKLTPANQLAKTAFSPAFVVGMIITEVSFNGPCYNNEIFTQHCPTSQGNLKLYWGPTQLPIIVFSNGLLTANFKTPLGQTRNVYLKLGSTIVSNQYPFKSMGFTGEITPKKILSSTITPTSTLQATFSCIGTDPGTYTVKIGGHNTTLLSLTGNQYTKQATVRIPSLTPGNYPVTLWRNGVKITEANSLYSTLKVK